MAAGRALTPERHARRTGWAAQATGEGTARRACAEGVRFACQGAARHVPGLSAHKPLGGANGDKPLGGQRKPQEEGQAPNYSLNVDFSVIVACNYSLKPDI